MKPVTINTKFQAWWWNITRLIRPKAWMAARVVMKKELRPAAVLSDEYIIGHKKDMKKQFDEWLDDPMTYTAQLSKIKYSTEPQHLNTKYL